MTIGPGPRNMDDFEQLGREKQMREDEDDLPGMLAVAKGVSEQRWPHTMDAAVWAAEYVKRYPGSDEGEMLGWFANAIMAGYDTAMQRAKRSSGPHESPPKTQAEKAADDLSARSETAPATDDTEREHMADLLERGWKEIAAFFQERNWPDTKLGNGASAIDNWMPKILKAIRSSSPSARATSDMEATALKPEPPSRLLAAFTATTYDGMYPPYINVKQVGSMIHISLRGTCKPNGEMGDHALAVVNVWHADQIAKALTEAVKGFETGFDSDPRSYA